MSAVQDAKVDRRRRLPAQCAVLWHRKGCSRSTTGVCECVYSVVIVIHSGTNLCYVETCYKDVTHHCISQIVSRAAAAGHVHHNAPRRLQHTTGLLHWVCLSEWMKHDNYFDAESTASARIYS